MCQVIISPEPTTRGNILRLIATSLRPGGTLFLVVPSVSSAVNIRAQHSRWLKERRRLKMPRDSEVEAGELTNPADEHRGIYQRAGVRTKHYTLVDLQVGRRRMLPACCLLPAATRYKSHAAVLSTRAPLNPCSSQPVLGPCTPT